MMEKLFSDPAKQNIDVEEFGFRNIQNIEYDKASTVYARFIDAGKSKTVSMRLLSGLLGASNKKYLPLKTAPITIEVEIVSDATEPLVSKG